MQVQIVSLRRVHVPRAHTAQKNTNHGNRGFAERAGHGESALWEGHEASHEETRYRRNSLESHVQNVTSERIFKKISFQACSGLWGKDVSGACAPSHFGRPNYTPSPLRHKQAASQAERVCDAGRGHLALQLALHCLPIRNRLFPFILQQALLASRVSSQHSAKNRRTHALRKSSWCTSIPYRPARLSHSTREPGRRTDKGGQAPSTARAQVLQDGHDLFMAFLLLRRSSCSGSCNAHDATTYAIIMKRMLPAMAYAAVTGRVRRGAGQIPDGQSPGAPGGWHTQAHKPAHTLCACAWAHTRRL